MNIDSAEKTAGRTDKLTENEYQRYWSESKEERQRIVRELYNNRDGGDPYATSRDYNQRELEIFAIKSYLDKKGSIVDLGCGNGYTLMSIARDLKDWSMVGVDFSENLIQGAKQFFEHDRETIQSSPTFICADAIRYVKELADNSVDYFITERFLLNLPDKITQFETIKDMYRALIPGGRLIMCEGSIDGFNSLNKLRSQVGLQIIPETSIENLSAIRFNDKELEEFVTKAVGFKLIKKLGFSTFFIMSRVLYPVSIMPDRPKFNAKINDHAREIQMNLPFEPGIGSNVLWILDKPHAK